MKNWYKSNLTKGILIVLEHVFAVAMAICIMFMLMYPGQEYGNAIENLSKTEYADTKGFERELHLATIDILAQLHRAENLETEGKYNPDKIVDVKEYVESGNITGENVSGIAYRLEDLKEWADEYEWYESQPSNIVVCQKPDGSYDYYTVDEFAQKVEKKEFGFWGNAPTDYLQAFKEGNAYEGNFGPDGVEVINANLEVVYSDMWNFERRIKEKVTTVDGKTLLEIVNTDPQWNGKLTELYDYLSEALGVFDEQVEAYHEMKEKWLEGNTNLTYLFADLNSGKLYTNRQKYNNIKNMDVYMEELKQDGKYVIATSKLADFESNIDTEAQIWSKNSQLRTNNYICMFSVDTSYPIQDQFYEQNKLFETYAPYMNAVVVFGMISLIGFFAALVWLTIIAGRTTNDDEVKLVWFDRVKTEIAAVGIVGVWSCFAALLGIGIAGWRLGFSDMILIGMLALVSCAAFLIGYLSLVRRIKAKTLWENSVLRWFIQAIKKFLQYISCIWKVVLAALAFIFMHWVAIGTSGRGGWMLLTFVVEGVAFYFLIRQAIAKEKIKKGIQEIADGNVNYQITLDDLKGDELDIAGQINNIGEGLNKAVEQSMKDERLKTDLITNVSHDIKTPLTSIINYVDLLKRENIQDPKIQGYIEILEAKAQRLKQLTEDVVEASKISSGNITMEYMNIDFVEMINQTTGEFSEKFAKKNLKAILNVPDHPVLIHSDGRRMWRVIENIYNNAAKYALENTRVYADLSEKDKTVEFSLKNISEQPLNISADELTERFIRGDVSRSTEGSGLGLSIAKNLTQMQGGEFNLYLDGDLFKVTIVFPKV